MRAPLFLALLLLAGCLGARDDTVPPGTPEAPRPAFTAESYLPRSVGFAEPGIKVAPDGTIYGTAPGADRLTPAGTPNVRGDTVWRSDDGGATWKVLPVPDRGTGGGDSDLAIAADGTVYQSGLWGTCVSLSASKDKGETWRNYPLGCGYAVTANDRNWIAAHKNEAVYTTFGWAPLGQGRIALIRTLVAGEPVGSTTATYEDNYQWPGNVAVDPRTGAVYVAYNTEDDEVVILRSLDSGRTLTKHTVAKRSGDTFDSFAVVAVGKDGTVYVTWSERNAPDGKQPSKTDVYYAYSLDGAATWSTPYAVNGFVGTHIYPWIDAGRAGHVALAWYGTNASGHIAEKVNGTWHVYLVESHAAHTAAPGFVEARVSQEPIQVGGICTSGTGCAPGSRTLLDYFQVAFDPAEAAHVLWASKAPDGQRATLAYAKQLLDPSASGAP